MKKTSIWYRKNIIKKAVGVAGILALLLMMSKNAFAKSASGQLAGVSVGASLNRTTVNASANSSGQSNGADCEVWLTLTAHVYDSDGTHTVRDYSDYRTRIRSVTSTISPAYCIQTYYSSSTHKVKYAGQTWQTSLSQ